MLSLLLLHRQIQGQARARSHGRRPDLGVEGRKKARDGRVTNVRLAGAWEDRGPV